jgi:anaerobic magnesium-protoporphyrin IX monomethyl ester cyclase
MIEKVLIVVPPLVNRDESDLDPSRPDIESYRLVSPVEPTSVAADLLGRGYAVRLFDLGAYMTERGERLNAFLQDFQPQAVVVVQSIITFATAQDWDGKAVFDAARRIDPGLVTILTGNNATNYPGVAVGEEVCTYSIKGEVDFAVGELLDRLNASQPLDNLAGLSRRVDGAVVNNPDSPSVKIESLPMPAYHILEPDQKSQYSKMLEFGKIRYPEKSVRYRDIMTSRSCTLRCSFCSVAHLRGETQKYRRKSVARILAEIEAALEDGVEEIHFFDDLFAHSEQQILEFTEAILRRRLKFHWFVAQGMPMWPLTKDALAAMREAGMYRVIAPFESGSNRVLKKVVGKVHSTVEHHHNVIEWVHAAGLELIGMFVIGMPGETRGEIYETLKFAESHPQIDYTVFSIATPMVGTRLMRQVVEQGRLDDQDKINRVIKRTVALYRTDEFSEYELGVIRAFDWDRINFSTPERQARYAGMVGITLQQLLELRQHSQSTFRRFFPDYDGPLSFHDLHDHPGMFLKRGPLIPQELY